MSTRPCCGTPANCMPPTSSCAPVFPSCPLWRKSSRPWPSVRGLPWPVYGSSTRWPGRPNHRVRCSPPSRSSSPATRFTAGWSWPRGPPCMTFSHRAASLWSRPSSNAWGWLSATASNWGTRKWSSATWWFPSRIARSPCSHWARGSSPTRATDNVWG